jgi:hypothetical protein
MSPLGIETEQIEKKGGRFDGRTFHLERANEQKKAE